MKYEIVEIYSRSCSCIPVNIHLDKDLIPGKGIEYICFLTCTFP